MKLKISTAMIHFDIAFKHSAWKLHWPSLSDICQDLCAEALKLCVIPPEKLEVEIILCDDAFIQEMNATYRQKDFPTNVLSFPQFQNLNEIKQFHARPLCLGSIIMSADTLEREATVQNKSLQHHGAHLFLHSFLHLLGFDHMTNKEAAEMEKIEVALLAQKHIVNPYEPGGSP